jgi:HD-like signal output (HDOD) protein
LIKKLSTAFYDAMFGTTHIDNDFNHIEEKALNNVRKILNDPHKISQQIPPLPVILLQLVDTLKNPHADFVEIATIIEKDPALAVEVLRVANSSLYFRGGSEITSLRYAVSLLGVTGVSNISMTILLEKIRPAKPIYYKMFGKQIWIHSVQCAFLCKMLASANKLDEFDEFDAYFLGLIHDIGKIIIFNCLCDALSSELPDSTPGSQVYKELMSEMSADISFFIAEEWQLPSMYCNALQAQRAIKNSPLAELLYKGNLLSEVYLLYKKKEIDDALIERLLDKLSVDKETWIEFLNLAPDIEKTVN